MKITLTGTGKKFNTEWIFKELSHSFEKDNGYAILGRNGSGKSTLLQVIAGNILPTSGKVTYSLAGQEIAAEKIFQHLTLVAPYQELIEEFTLREMLDFHFFFKRPVPGVTIPDIISRIGFKDPGRKTIRFFSSGMKQRVKLVLALFSDVSLVLLDEPTMNLDETGSNWYLQLVSERTKNRIIIVCSNLQQQETSFCKEKLFIEDYKPQKVS
ncbi:MAG: ATP-binding cassette domain-containing protein [Bacteroidetes bacterium]|nr:ATP-binding cassette domain-containing protein [Bacteroidota bacterium]